MSLKSSLVWYWDLDSADATITDQHSGLSLSRVGTTATISGGAPDGGDCISVGAAAGKYRNASVPKTISYDDGYTVNIWVFSTGSSSFANWVIQHRSNPTGGFAGGQYFQILARISTAIDTCSTIDAATIFRDALSAQENLNVWQMLTLRDTGTTTELYRNALLVGTSSTVLGARNTTAAVFSIGGEWNSGVNAAGNHRGRLAMAGVWNEPLSAAEITRLYNGGAGLRYAALGGGVNRLINGGLINGGLINRGLMR